MIPVVWLVSPDLRPAFGNDPVVGGVRQVRVNKETEARLNQAQNCSSLDCVQAYAQADLINLGKALREATGSVSGIDEACSKEASWSGRVACMRSSIQEQIAKIEKNPPKELSDVAKKAMVNSQRLTALAERIASGAEPRDVLPQNMRRDIAGACGTEPKMPSGGSGAQADAAYGGYWRAYDGYKACVTEQILVEALNLKAGYASPQQARALKSLKRAASAAVASEAFMAVCARDARLSESDCAKQLNSVVVASAQGKTPPAPKKSQVAAGFGKPGSSARSAREGSVRGEEGGSTKGTLDRGIMLGKVSPGFARLLGMEDEDSVCRKATAPCIECEKKFDHSRPLPRNSEKEIRELMTASHMKFLAARRLLEKTLDGYLTQLYKIALVEGVDSKSLDYANRKLAMACQPSGDVSGKGAFGTDLKKMVNDAIQREMPKVRQAAKKGGKEEKGAYLTSIEAASRELAAIEAANEKLFSDYGLPRMPQDHDIGVGAFIPCAVTGAKVLTAMRQALWLVGEDGYCGLKQTVFLGMGQFNQLNDQDKKRIQVCNEVRGKVAENGAKMAEILSMYPELNSPSQDDKGREVPLSTRLHGGKDFPGVLDYALKGIERICSDPDGAGQEIIDQPTKLAGLLACGQEGGLPVDSIECRWLMNPENTEAACRVEEIRDKAAIGKRTGSGQETVAEGMSLLTDMYLCGAVWPSVANVLMEGGFRELGAAVARNIVPQGKAGWMMTGTFGAGMTAQQYAAIDEMERQIAYAASHALSGVATEEDFDMIKAYDGDEALQKAFAETAKALLLGRMLDPVKSKSQLQAAAAAAAAKKGGRGPGGGGPDGAESSLDRILKVEARMDARIKALAEARRSRSPEQLSRLRGQLADDLAEAITADPARQAEFKAQLRKAEPEDLIGLLKERQARALDNQEFGPLSPVAVREVRGQYGDVLKDVKTWFPHEERYALRIIPILKDRYKMTKKQIRDWFEEKSRLCHAN